MSRRNKPAGQYAFDVYKRQETRGKQGYGYLAVSGDRIVNIFRCKNEYELRAQLHKEKAEKIFLHHRLPTSTKNTVGTTHPIFVSNPELRYDYFIAHNGVITNARFLKPRHEELGYKYTTEFREINKAVYTDGREEDITGTDSVFNDSESLAIEIARNLEGHTDRIATVGSAAFWGLAVEKGTNTIHRFFFGKNHGRDLKFHSNKKWFVVASETGKDLKEMVMYSVNLNTEEIEESELVTDLAKPTVGYNNNWGSSRAVANLPEPKTTQPPIDTQKNKDHLLENKMYTFNEACDTGVPLEDFFTTMIGDQKLYIPYTYAGKTQERKSLTSKKEHIQLESYVMRIAAVESELDELYDFKHTVWGWNDTETPESRETEQEVQRLELELEDLEAKCSALGIEEEFVQEMLDLARQIQSS